MLFPSLHILAVLDGVALSQALPILHFLAILDRVVFHGPSHSAFPGSTGRGGIGSFSYMAGWAGFGLPGSPGTILPPTPFPLLVL